MQISGNVAAWGQRELAPTADNRRYIGSAAQQGEEKTVLNAAAGNEKKEEESDSYEQSDAGMLSYLEILKTERSSGDRQRQVQSDELKALRIAHNIMRGKKVPPKDESFLLTKNFKMYMAAKNVASMKECTGTAKSELGSDSASSATGGGSSGAVSAAAGSTSATAGGTAEAGCAASVSDGLAELFSSGAQGTDYSTLLEGMKASDGMVRSNGISRSVSNYSKKKKYRRLQYNFKEISARIMSAKTSGNAKQVLTQARQRSAMLRKKLKSGEYDEEAVQIALIHAEAMERVAKKKMRHLEEEEAATKSGGVCAGDTDHEDRMEQQLQDEQMLYEMQTANNPEAVMADLTGTMATNPELPLEEVSIEELMAEAVQTSVLDITDEMTELMEDFAELMEDTLEDVSGLNELAEDMLSGGGKTIDPADLEEKKRKHRTEEQRAIAEADSKYLKAFFNKLQREQRAVASGASKLAAAMNNGGGMFSLVSNAAPAATASAGSAAGTSGSADAAAAPVQTEAVSAAESAGTIADGADLSVSVDAAVSVVASVDVSI